MWQRNSILLLLLIISFMTAPVAIALRKNGGRVGEFKGYVAYNDHLRTRLLDDSFAGNHYFQFARFLGDTGSLGSGLASLLGMYSGSGNVNDFRNGTPNALNMLLWYLGTYALAQKMRQAACEDHTPMVEINRTQAKLAAPIFTALQQYCAADSHETQRQALTSLWMTFFAFDLPPEEFQAYVDFFAADSSVQALTPAARTEHAVLALLMHPLLLLER